jgi:hypothetical protein
MKAIETVEDFAVVSRNRVTDAVRMALHIAINVERRFTVLELAAQSGVKVRAIRSYMSQDETEVREPSLSAALSLALVLGPRTVNAILSIIGYGGAKPMADEDELPPMEIIAAVVAPLNTLVQAASDGRFDHTERAACRDAADQIIAAVMPLSSAAEAV